MNRLWVLGCLVVLSGCSTMQKGTQSVACSANPECGLQQDLDKYVGMELPDLLLKEGNPETKISGKGIERYVYRRCSGVSVGLDCREVYFDVQRGKVVKASFKPKK